MSFPTQVQEPAFIIQPDEMLVYKQMRILIDRQFVNCKPSWSPRNIYFDFIPSREGIDMYLRSNLFSSSKKHSSGGQLTLPNVLSFGSMETQRTEQDDRRKESMKLTQRESKQKDRWENRLLSLLFSAVYDINTKRCFLLRGIPPLRVFKQDKNRKRRRVSNFGEVRTFLRQTMTRCISLHANAMKAVFELAYEHVLLLPVVTVVIARTFVPFYYSVCEEVSGTGEDSTAAVKAVDMCLSSICQFISDWERRNYSSDIDLECSLQANRNHELYKASEDLLLALINVLPPSKPTLEHFKKGSVYGHGIIGKNTCKRGKHKSCAVCDLSLQTGSGFDFEYAQRSAAFCRQYVDAISKCIALDPPALRILNGRLDVEPNHTPLWKSIISVVCIHRLQSLCKAVCYTSRSEEAHPRLAEFVESVRWEVARMWIALDSSNAETMKFIQEMKVTGHDDVLQAVTELVIGTTVTTRALSEEQDKIKDAVRLLHHRNWQETLGDGNPVPCAQDEEEDGISERQASNEPLGQGGQIYAGSGSPQVSRGETTGKTMVPLKKKRCTANEYGNSISPTCRASRIPSRGSEQLPHGEEAQTSMIPQVLPPKKLTRTRKRKKRT